MEENIKITNDIIKAVYAHISKRYDIDNSQVFEFITKQADINNQACNDYILDYYNNVILKDDEYCNTTLELSDEVINRVYYDIHNMYGTDYKDIYDYITHNANLNNQSREQYILDYYENIKLKDNKNNSVIIEDIDKVNFEELTETDKKVIASRKYMYHEYIKEIVYKLNELINRDLSNDRHAVDESAIVMYTIQAIERDVANAVNDCQKVLKLMKSKCS
jgi:hypothetical protein